MIDTHCHILPGIDDGAQTLVEALQMAQSAADHGITTVIATPHVSLGASASSIQNIIQAMSSFQTHLQHARIPVSVLPGAELALTAGATGAIITDSTLALGGQGRYILVEAPGFALPYRWDDTLFALQCQGYRPILAHPERLPVVVQNPGILEAHMQRGLLLQVTAPSILGHFGRAVRRTAETLIRHRWVSLLASDAHDAHQYPMLSTAMAVVAKWISAQDTDELVTNNADRIIRGDDLQIAPHPYRPFRQLGWAFR